LNKKTLEKTLYELKIISLNMDSKYHEELEIIDTLLSDSKYRIAVIGEFSTGKSTFLNALIGKDILFSSNIEATGPITLIESGTEKKAIIYNSEYQVIDEFQLDNSTAIDALNKYINIKNYKKTNADKVHIYYPMEHIPNDILLIDTPGLQGISKEQLLITKDILRQVNAVIFLVGKKGFTETALDLLCGRNKEFGRVNTKNIFLLMTKIGEIYDNKDVSNPKENIEKLKNDIIMKMEENGMTDIPVYEIDNRDYLWSQDNEAYDKALKKAQKDGKTLLSQEEYGTRSKYEEFKTKLFDFLQDDKRAENYLRDIADKLELITDDMLQHTEETKDVIMEENAQLLQKIDENLQIACDSQRQFYNKITRTVYDYISHFSSGMEEDLSQLNNKQMIAVIIQDLIRDKSDLNDKQISRCFDKVKNIVYDKQKQLELEVNKHKDILINTYLKEKFKDEFLNLFHSDIQMDSISNYNDIKIELQQDKTAFDLEEDTIKDYRNRIEEQNRKIEYLRKTEMVLVEVDQVFIKEGQLASAEKRCENEYETKITKLGVRPAPKQKFRERSYTTGILFWKKTHYETVPDGLDYTMCDQWDKNLDAIQDQYNKRIDEIHQLQDRNNQNIRELHNIQRQIEECNRSVIRYRRSIDELEEGMQQIIKKNEKIFVDRKKNDILYACNEMMSRMYQEIGDRISEYLSSLRNLMRDDVKIYVDKYLKEYREEQIVKSKEIAKQINFLKTGTNKMGMQLRKIREDITYEL
jgi:GTPase Era involved in 16S rRNA processing